MIVFVFHSKIMIFFLGSKNCTTRDSAYQKCLNKKVEKNENE